MFICRNTNIFSRTSCNTHLKLSRFNVKQHCFSKIVLVKNQNDGELTRGLPENIVL